MASFFFFFKFDNLNPKINFFLVIFITHFSETINKSCLTSGEKVISKHTPLYSVVYITISNLENYEHF